ncbi:MAG: hypothetical protein ACE5GN_01430 [Waddliaceae bacterium]
MYLKDRLQTAEVGDYIVAALDNTYTAIIIKEKSPQKMSIEEITVPAARLRQHGAQWTGWKDWIQNGAQGNTSWVVYTIHRLSGEMTGYFSYTKNSWCDISQIDSFMSTLLNLRLEKMKQESMKKVGPAPPGGTSDKRRAWAPKMVFEGNVIHDIAFQGWRTYWPKDNSDLSGKIIFVYVPEDSSKYPSYFPYWLEIRGVTGKAKIRVIDSGKNLQSPRPSPKS